MSDHSSLPIARVHAAMQAMTDKALQTPDDVVAIAIVDSTGIALLAKTNLAASSPVRTYGFNRTLSAGDVVQYQVGVTAAAQSSPLGLEANIAAANWNVYRDFYLAPTASGWTGATTPGLMGGAWGYYDAKATPVGPDGGLDVIASRALAQVKYRNVKTSRTEINEFHGSAEGSGKDELYFSRSGYTQNAIERAEDKGIALYVFNDQGIPKPVNSAARRIASK